MVSKPPSGSRSGSARLSRSRQNPRAAGASMRFTALSGITPDQRSLFRSARAGVCIMIGAWLLGAASPGTAQVRLTYLGTAGWEITDGKTVVLIDPYLS